MTRNKTAGGGSVSMPRLLSEKQVEQFYGLPVKTLQRWRLERKGPRFRRLGGNAEREEKTVERSTKRGVVRYQSGPRGMVRYLVDDIETWIAAAPAGGGAV